MTQSTGHVQGVQLHLAPQSHRPSTCLSSLTSCAPPIFGAAQGSATLPKRTCQTKPPSPVSIWSSVMPALCNQLFVIQCVYILSFHEFIPEIISQVQGAKFNGLKPQLHLLVFLKLLLTLMPLTPFCTLLNSFKVPVQVLNTLNGMVNSSSPLPQPCLYGVWLTIRSLPFQALVNAFICSIPSCFDLKR